MKMGKNTSHNLKIISKNIYDKELVSIIYNDVLKLGEENNPIRKLQKI